MIMDQPASPFPGRTRWLDAQGKEQEAADCQLTLADDALSVSPRQGQVAAPLRQARASFLGRAIHNSSWKSQLDAALTRAGTI